MPSHLTAYELSQSQVTTPKEVVRLFWKLTKKYRQKLDCVLDMGAGDCRLGFGGNFRQYVGVEIDKARVAEAQVPKNGKIICGCVFRHEESDYDALDGLMVPTGEELGWFLGYTKAA
jgi:predicted RNA methylase